VGWHNCLVKNSKPATGQGGAGQGGAGQGAAFQGAAPAVNTPDTRCC
jgi:hypothetical protein